MGGEGGVGGEGGEGSVGGGRRAACLAPLVERLVLGELLLLLVELLEAHLDVGQHAVGLDATRRGLLHDAEALLAPLVVDLRASDVLEQVETLRQQRGGASQRGGGSEAAQRGGGSSTAARDQLRLRARRAPCEAVCVWRAWWRA